MGGGWGRDRIVKRLWVLLILVVAGCSGSATTSTTLGPTASTATTSTPEASTPGALTPTTSTAPGALVIGSSGIGDSLYEDLGNSGYDVETYALDLEFDGEHLSGTATLALSALEPLESFYLDLTGLDVTSVVIDGLAVEFDLADELQIRPAEPLPAGQAVDVEIEYGGVPDSIQNLAGNFTVGWHKSVDGWFALSEPGGAETWFPSNNHPLDKATFSVEITVPADLVAVSSGALQNVSDDGSTYLWETADPVAPYLVALAIADFDRVSETTPGGVMIDNYFDNDVSKSDLSLFDRQGEMLDYFAELFGPYPFEQYGALVLETEQTSAALETQTRSTFGTQILVLGEAVVAHELVHQWYGDSVSVADWSDIWLNEGFATYGQWLWAGHIRGTDDLTPDVVAAYRTLSGDSLAEAVTDPIGAYERALSLYPPPGSPTADNLFSLSVYVRGGVTLHALRLELGDESFFELLRTWASEHRHGNASTDDFLSLVEDEGGQDARTLVEAWLFSPDLPSIDELDLHPPS